MSSKRPSENFSAEKPRKKPTRAIIIKHDSDEENIEEKVFNFRVLLPNGTTLELQLSGPPNEMPVQDFVLLVNREYRNTLRRTVIKPKRKINWDSKDLHFVDAFENIMKVFNFRKLEPNKSHLLRLYDGSAEVDKYENMWDLTPHTDLLKELPEAYTYETALADLIDNSLQAVWSNCVNQRRLISLKLTEEKITLFDTGPGMDGSDENSMVKWGKIGASLHRLSRVKGIGGKPPYLTPFFGLFGYGGPIASMHLGRRALVSSKTKKSKKVHVLHLERESLLNCSSSQKLWRTDGNVRDPLEVELREATDGSFTKIEIFNPKMSSRSLQNLKYKLKDIYFPYIQCDEVSTSGRTMMPIEFRVNGTNLAEIAGGEVASTNLLTCNGPEFILELSFHVKDGASLKDCSGRRSHLEANARLRCVYLPVLQGKETIEVILEKLEADGYGIKENFESFCRVSVRRLGRLLPDSRWAWLPFMEPKQRKGDRAEILKRCCFRVKCFVETDAGFKPTPSKTDLANHHPYTIALKNFGNKPSDKENDVQIDIIKDGKKLTLLQVEKLYQEWMFQMHDRYDKEVDSGEDQPTFVLGPTCKKELGVTSDVVRIHKVFRRKGVTWKSGQKIKILKGAYKGFHKTNVFATLEFIVLEGWQGDTGGEARIICRPLNIPAERGCLLTSDKGGSAIEIRDSKSLPINVLDNGKCLSVDDSEWENQLLKHQEKTTPSSIDILDAKQCQELGIDGALPQDAVDSGHEPPEEIVAVVRPTSSSSMTASKNLDQKYIMKENFEMSVEVKFIADESKKDISHIYSGRLSPSSLKGFQGLYILPLKKLPDLFQKAGDYLFRFSLKESGTITEKKVHVKPLSEACSWKITSDGKTTPSVRVGSCLPEIFSVACYDRFSNRIPFKLHTEIEVKLSSGSSAVEFECSYDHYVTRDRYTMKLKKLCIETSDLDKIRPSYEATIHINSKHDQVSAAIPCAVIPGPLQHVFLRPVDFGKNLVPDMIIKELVLETFDKYGNHLRKDDRIKLKLEGFQLLDKGDHFFKVNDHGCVKLSGILKVIAGYGKPVALSVFSGDQEVFKKEFQTEMRLLRTSSKVPEVCATGSHLEDIAFEVRNSADEVDEDIHDEEENGRSHTLVIRQESLRGEDNVKYSFFRGRCIVRSVPLPKSEGLFSFVASHSRFHELQTSIEVRVKKAVNSEHEITLPRTLQKETMLVEDSLSPKSQGVVVYDHSCNEFSDGSIMLFKDSPTLVDLEDGLQNHIEKKLVDDICKYGLRIRECESNMNALHVKQSNILLELSNLRANIDLDSFPTLGLNKDMVVQRIEEKADSAAAVVHKLLKLPKSKHLHLDLVNEILGVVALLGEVKTHKLSSMFSAYLGEDQMLAIVCKSQTAARTLEKYQMDGNVNCAISLELLEDKLGISVNGRYLVICLEDIRPYRGGLRTDPQRELAIPGPTSSEGKTPAGFLGYAVNMILLPREHLRLRTASGYDLRETLFYRLLGKLQVYESREHLYMARSCIKHGAVSLDGGMMRGNGVVSVGYVEPYILFPVPLSTKQVDTLKRIEEKRLELSETEDQIKEESTTHAKYKKKLEKKLEYKKQLEESVSFSRNVQL